MARACFNGRQICNAFCNAAFKVLRPKHQDWHTNNLYSIDKIVFLSDLIFMSRYKSISGDITSDDSALRSPVSVNPMHSCYASA